MIDIRGRFLGGDDVTCANDLEPGSRLCSKSADTFSGVVVVAMARRIPASLASIRSRFTPGRKGMQPSLNKSV